MFGFRTDQAGVTSASAAASSEGGGERTVAAQIELGPQELEIGQTWEAAAAAAARRPGALLRRPRARKRGQVDRGAERQRPARRRSCAGRGCRPAETPRYLAEAVVKLLDQRDEDAAAVQRIIDGMRHRARQQRAADRHARSQAGRDRGEEMSAARGEAAGARRPGAIAIQAVLVATDDVARAEAARRKSAQKRGPKKRQRPQPATTSHAHQASVQRRHLSLLKGDLSGDIAAGQTGHRHADQEHADRISGDRAVLLLCFDRAASAADAD